jgi:rhodanese-related sulfurtransferase
LEFIQQNIYLVTIAVLSGAMLVFTSMRRPGAGNGLSPTQATLLINREDAVVIDVREPSEYVEGHVPESRNIPMSQLESRVSEIEKFKDKPLILVCRSGARSSSACSRLVRMGFTKVNNLDGGVGDWAQAGLPLRKGAKK